MSKKFVRFDRLASRLSCDLPNPPAIPRTKAPTGPASPKGEGKRMRGNGSPPPLCRIYIPPFFPFRRALFALWLWPMKKSWPHPSFRFYLVHSELCGGAIRHSEMSNRNLRASMGKEGNGYGTDGWTGGMNGGE